MTEEYDCMSEKDARDFLDFDASLKLITGYCQRCFVDINREDSRAKCQSELERLAEMNAPLGDVSAEELIDACKNCDYEMPHVVSALEKE